MLERIIAKEKPDAILPTMGGQTALNLAMDLSREGILEKYGVELIGAKPDVIDKAEDRQRFKEAMERSVWNRPARASPTTWPKPWLCSSAWGSRP